MGYLKAGDTISGQEGTAVGTISNTDGTTSVETLFFVKKVEAKVEIQKKEIKVIGRRGTQNKPTGFKGSGSMDMFYITSIFRKMIIEYIKTGKMPYFNLLTTNSDPASTVGAQTTLLKNCLLDEAIVAKLDAEAEVLDESVTFTFDDVDILESFVPPTLGT